MKLLKEIACLGLVLSSAVGSAQQSPKTDLTTLPLEDLMQLEVTSVSRSPQKVSDSPAAITVITGDDIRRSGATSIPEALRTVPGLNVAKVDAHSWAISSRGFNDVFANKLLVMIDGGSIYTPLFSGVYWETRDTLLEDIERIEVVRGPGATLWGANAVNGVINIITKSAQETHGLLFSGGGGTEELGFGNLRYGLKINDETHARVYAKYFNRDDSKLSNGMDAEDAWKMAQGGFRIDWQPAQETLFTFQGDVYAGTLDQSFMVPSPAPPFASIIAEDAEGVGGNLLGRWSHTFSDESEMSLQIFYDRAVRNATVLSEDRDTADADFQHQFSLSERQKIIWGLGFRRTSDEIDNSLNFALNPRHRSSELFSSFVQDEITVVPDKVTLTIGSKFEHNDFTGFEMQPGIRLLWKPSEHQALWGSVSRAVRTPSRAEDDIVINPAGAPPGFASLFGNRSFDSEKLIAYELGYRIQPAERLTLDFATFYNDYDDLRSLRPLTPLPIGPVTAANELRGETYGFELAGTVQMAEGWRLHAGYNYLQMQIHRKSGSLDAATEQALELSSPHHQFFARSSWEFGRRFELDSTLRYVDNIAVSGKPISSYLTMDLRFAWKPNHNWELAIVGQNLMDNQNPEFAPTFAATQRTEVERSIYAKVTWRF